MVGSLKVVDTALSFCSKAKGFQAIAHRFHKERADRKARGRKRWQGQVRASRRGRFLSQIPESDSIVGQTGL